MSLVSNLYKKNKILKKKKKKETIESLSGGDKIEIKKLNFNGEIVPEEEFLKVGGKKTIENLISNLKLTLNDKKYSDLTLIVEKKKFFCHKLILSQW